MIRVSCAQFSWQIFYSGELQQRKKHGSYKWMNVTVSRQPLFCHHAILPLWKQYLLAKSFSLEIFSRTDRYVPPLKRITFISFNCLVNFPLIKIIIQTINVSAKEIGNKKTPSVNIRHFTKNIFTLSLRFDHLKITFNYQF